jgi:P2 family phage contractile tail tube protein
VEGVRLRLVGAYRADDGSPAQAVEIYVGGRFTEIDMGKDKPGDATEHKYTCAVAYYRRVVDGRTEVEIDMLRGVFMVDGIDRYAEIMAILTS